MIKDFLTEMYRGCKDGCITVTTLPDRRNLHFPVTEIDKVAEAIEALGQTRHTYYNTALRKPGLDEYTRGGEEDIHSVVCMFADIDIAGPAHKQTALPETKEEVLSFLDELQLPASYIIDSGNGIHAIWLLEEAFTISSADDLRLIKSISTGFGAHIIREGQKHGWLLDNVQDIPRMLRAPGTLNFKSDPPNPCAILTHNEVRYPLTTFEQYKAEPKEFEPVVIDDGIIGSAERMRGRCAFIDCCVNDAGSLPEPWWHAMLSIVALTEDGQEKCHEWSEPYYGYDPDQTEERFKRALKENKPCSCEFISRALGFNCPDGGCQNYVGCQNCGKPVRGPIAFAFYSKEEQIEKLLDRDLDVDAAMEEKNLLLAAYAKESAPALFVRLKKKYQKLGISARDLENSIKSARTERASADKDFFGMLHLDGIDTTGLALPENWELTMDGLKHMVLTSMGMQIVSVTATPLLITKKIEDLNDGSEKLELSFLRNHRWKRITVPRGDVMDKSKLVKYASSGFPVSSGNNQALVQFLAAFEEINADAITFHRSVDRLGWVTGTTEFYPYHMKDEVVFESTTSEASRLVKSIRTEGSEKAWMEMAVKLRTMPFARAMLAASFASVLLEPLQQRIIYLHLWKDSRSGKTAAQKAAVSIWGDPAGLMVSYNSTAVGFERSAAAMNHLPLALDELQSSSIKAEYFSRILYMLGNGIGKVRGDKFGGTQELLHWRNVILSTGEQPIIVGNSMDGVVTRVMELMAAPFEDEAFAAEVHRISETNYGFAGEKFIAYLFNQYFAEKNGSAKGGGEKDGAAKLRADYDHLTDLIDMLYDLFDGKEAGFHLGNVAVIAFADYLSSMALFGLEKDQAENEAIDLALVFLRNIHSHDKADSIDRAWDYVVDWTKSNKMHFEVKKRMGTGFDRAGVSPIYGRYFPEEKKVAFIPSCLYKALTDGGYSVEKCYAGFKERGYVDQVQKKIRVDGNNPKTIIAEIELDLKALDDAVEDDFQAAFS